MAKTYRIIQQWNHWLTHFLGKSLLEYEQKAIASMQSGEYGTSTLLLGVSNQSILLQASLTSSKFLLSPIIDRKVRQDFIESDYYDLPIHSGSVDQVILPHTLEMVENPRQLFNEACRIVKPEGTIYIAGFNPYSLWGLKKFISKHLEVPFNRQFIALSTIKTWLSHADFQLEKENSILFRPAAQHYKLYKNLKFLEWIGNKCYKPFGAVYILQAKAKVIPLTPIRLTWKQELSGIEASRGVISGTSIRNKT